MTIDLAIHTNAIDISSFQSTSFQAIWTGNPTGVITIEASLSLTNPDQLSDPLGLLWSDIGASIPNQPSGCPGSTYVPVYASCAKWLRLTYTNTPTSEMGQLSVVAMSKTR